MNGHLTPQPGTTHFCLPPNNVIASAHLNNQTRILARSAGTRDSTPQPPAVDKSNDDNNIPHDMACNLRCCCGQPSCAYLEHNNTALGGLEKDLETAAKLGQVRVSLHCMLQRSPNPLLQLSSFHFALLLEMTRTSHDL
jgi:hypothetical protein